MEIAKKTPGFLTLGSSDEFPGEAWSSVFFGAVLIRYTVRAYSREHHKHIYMATGEVVGNLWKIIVQLHCKTYIYRIHGTGMFTYLPNKKCNEIHGCSFR